VSEFDKAMTVAKLKGARDLHHLLLASLPAHPCKTMADRARYPCIERSLLRIGLTPCNWSEKTQGVISVADPLGRETRQRHHRAAGGPISHAYQETI
jgi:hypothetical protein